MSEYCRNYKPNTDLNIIGTSIVGKNEFKHSFNTIRFGVYTHIILVFFISSRLFSFLIVLPISELQSYYLMNTYLYINHSNNPFNVSLYMSSQHSFRSLCMQNIFFACNYINNLKYFCIFTTLLLSLSLLPSFCLSVCYLCLFACMSAPLSFSLFPSHSPSISPFPLYITMTRVDATKGQIRCMFLSLEISPDHLQSWTRIPKLRHPLKLGPALPICHPSIQTFDRLSATLDYHNFF